MTSDDLPEPLTPVTAVSTPTGNRTVRLRRLCALAPLMVRYLLPGWRRGAIERQILSAHVGEGAHAIGDLAQDPLGDRRLALGELELLKELVRVADRQAGEVVDRQRADLDEARLLAQAGALALLAGRA